MKHIMVVGCQWGDEGKGIVTYTLALNADGSFRVQGADNAGHTVTNDKGSYHLHLLPATAVMDKKIVGILPELALNPQQLFFEISDLENDFISDTKPKLNHTGVSDPIANRLMIDTRTKLNLPWYRFLDGAEEFSKGKDKIGTTMKGVGPFYNDVRDGVRCDEICDKDKLYEKIKRKSEFFQSMIVHGYKTSVEKRNEIITFLTEREYTVYGHLSKTTGTFGFLANYTHFYHAEKGFNADNIMQLVELFKNKHGSNLNDVVSFVHENKHRMSFLFEGAQGTHLDRCLGTYPYVTSSFTTTGGLAVVGIPLDMVDERIGITKAYNTRVGAGPFPTRMDPDSERAVREIGGEYGTTTGRARDCGWIDIDQLIDSVRWNGLNGIAMTKLDVLSNLPKVYVHSKSGPIEFEGWPGFDSGNITNYHDLPDNAKTFIMGVSEMLEKYGAVVKYVKYGPHFKDIVETGL
jgi:adenylosuccinate synthase